MQLRKLLDQWDLNSLKIKTPFLEMEWVSRDEDKTAAWDLYVELLTRVAVQRLTPAQGQEFAALNSIYQLFPITRDIIKKNGRYCINFAKIAIVVLNQLVRPFTTKWHRVLDLDASLSEEKAIEFRIELVHLQNEIRKYVRLLADMAGVEDLSEIEV